MINLNSLIHHSIYTHERLIMKHVAMIAGSIVFIIYSSITNGFVFSNFWEWFLVPVIEGLPILSLPQAIGVMGLVSVPLLGVTIILTLLTLEFPKEINVLMYVLLALFPWILLFGGWIVTWFL